MSRYYRHFDTGKYHKSATEKICLHLHNIGLHPCSNKTSYLRDKRNYSLIRGLCHTRTNVASELSSVAFVFYSRLTRQLPSHKMTFQEFHRNYEAQDQNSLQCKMHTKRNRSSPKFQKSPFCFAVETQRLWRFVMNWIEFPRKSQRWPETLNAQIAWLRAIETLHSSTILAYFTQFQPWMPSKSSNIRCLQ